MLALLTDAHLSPQVAPQVKARRPEISIFSLRNWRNGALLNADDSDILTEAQTEGLTLVTYDQTTINPLLTQWAMEGRDHAGVIFVSRRSIAQSDIGGQVRALIALWDFSHSADWTNVVHYLTPTP
jgi:hypothetical protein